MRRLPGSVRTPRAGRPATRSHRDRRAAVGRGRTQRMAEGALQELGLTDVHQDELGNVFGIRPGTDPDAPYIALSAHIDTVFPAGTAIDVRRDAGKLYGPGISDNSSGIVALLAIAGAMRDAAITNLAPVLFIGNVGEEGEGDLRGMRHIFQQPNGRHHCFAGRARRRRNRHHHCRRPGQPALRGHRTRSTAAIPGATSASRIRSLRWRGSSTASRARRCRLRRRRPTTSDHSGRHVGQLHSGVGDHAGGHALGFGGGTRPAGARAARGGGRTSLPRCPAARKRR